MTEAEHLAWLSEVIVESADAAGIGIVITLLSPQMRHVYSSRAAASILKTTPEEMLRTDPLSFVMAEDQERVMALVTNFVRGGELISQIELTVRAADGSTVTVESSATPTSIDGYPAVVSFIVDVSRRRQAEQSLGLSEERFRRVIETVPEAIYITDGLSLEYANPGFRELFRVERHDKLEGRSILEFVHPHDAPAFIDRSKSLLDRVMPPGEYRMVTRDARTLMVELSSIAIEFEGHPRILSFGRDITERKQVEAQLMQADRLAALGTLAGGMAHAINNPLAYVLLNLEHLSRRLPDLASDRDHIAEARVRLAEARDGAERVAAVVRQMRHFSRMRRPDEEGPVDVRAAVQTTLDLVANEIRHRGQLATNLREVPAVFGSEGQIEQALLTLLIFAARSLPEEAHRSGRLEIETSSDSDGHVVVTIRCSGTAIGPQSLERIVEPFAGAGDEAGLGLAVCADIVNGLNGTLTVDSDESTAVFRVVLPASDRGVPVEQAEVQPAESVRTRSEQVSVRVLVIDDDPGVASGLRVLLQEQHDVTSVASARDGLRVLLEGGEFDVVFCDLMMPDMSGEDVYDALKLNRPGAESKLVFMTGAAFTPDVERFLSSVPNPRVEKPFNLEQVEHLLRRTGRARAQMQKESPAQQ